MPYQHVQHLIDDYLQCGLDTAARTTVETHTAGCRSCRQGLESAREAMQVLRWLPHPDAPPQPGPDFYYRVQAAIEKRQARSWLLKWTAGLQPRLALPVLTMGILLLVLMILPRRAAHAVNPTEGWEEVEFPSADFAAMTYSDDVDESRHDRMMTNLFEAPEAE